TVQINDGLTTTTTGTYIQQTGSLQVTISPPGAVTAGAKWRVDSGAWRDSDYTESSLPVGLHTVDFNEIVGWTKPANQMVLINDGLTTITSGNYIQQTHALLTINEFMASNTSAEPLEEGELLDGNGESSDWIEIYNPTDEIVDLDGWYLTDDNTDLTMWQFPDGNQLEPGEFMIIFASQKTYAENPLNYPYLDPAGYYHTNFELYKGGDYLALVAPDGNTVVHEYTPEYPVQLTNISYGLAQYATTLVSAGATATYHVPTIGDAGLGTDWTDPNFDDSSWDTGETGLGFGNVVPGLNVTYYKANTTVDSLTAAEAVISEPSMQTTVVTETASVINYFNTGNEGHYVNNNPFPGTTIGSDVEDFVVLVTGMVLISDADQWTFGVNSDDGFGLELTNGIDVFTSSHPTPRGPGDTLAVFNITQPGMYDLRLLFYERGGGSELELFAARGNFATFDPASFDLVGDTASGGLYVSSMSNEVETDVQQQMQNINASLWTRIEFNLEEGQRDIFDTLTLRMKYEDGFVAYLNGQYIAEQNAPASLQWNSTATSDRPSEDSLVFEEINLMAFVDVLQTGTNALAIHGLNDDPANDEFLILPELVAASNISVPQYFTTPTPGAFNITGAEDIVSDVWFSHKRGFYDAPFQLMLSTAMNDAEICYTLDGSRPTITHGITYTGLLDVNETTTIRAAAVKPGWLNSPVETHTYVFLDDVVTQSPNGEAPGPGWPPGSVNGQIFDYGMDPNIVNDGTWGPQLEEALTSIPTMSIVIDLNDLFDPATGIYVNAGAHGRAWERPASLELLYPPNLQGPGFPDLAWIRDANGAVIWGLPLDMRDGFQVNTGLRIRGGYSRNDNNPKHAFRLFFRGEYGAGKLNYPLFGSEGVDSFNKVDLRTAQNYSWSYGGDSSNTMCREVWARDSQGLTGQAYTRSRYYHLYINGHYWGLFQTQERAEASHAASYLG
ncbi:MAG: lamin tail domain-containing protein, partial [Planctomycetota bacterium]